MEVLISEQELQERVNALGAELTGFYRDKPLTVICTLTGGVMFAADLLRRIELPLYFDTLAAASYSGTASTGELTFRSKLKLPVRDRHILIVDDILETGLTLHKVRELFTGQGALSVRCCVLLEKDVPHQCAITPDWVGFKIPDRFIVGYGLDCDECYRNLPYVACLQ